MDYISLLTGSVINFTATIIVAIAIHVPFLMHALLSVPYVPPPQTPAVAVAATSSAVARKYIPPSEPPPITSSSTAQVGKFTVVVNCADKDPKTINVLKNGVVLQTFGILDASVGGVSKCPSAVSQDVNFDGYPDITLLTGTGSGGGSVSYWLYSTTTGEFSCNEPYNTCGFMNPKFDPSTKTVTSEGQMGVGSIQIQIYQAVNGQLVQTKQYSGSDEGAIKEGFRIEY